MKQLSDGGDGVGLRRLLVVAAALYPRVASRHTAQIALARLDAIDCNICHPLYWHVCHVASPLGRGWHLRCRCHGIGHYPLQHPSGAACRSAAPSGTGVPYPSRCRAAWCAAPASRGLLRLPAGPEFGPRRGPIRDRPRCRHHWSLPAPLPLAQPLRPPPVSPYPRGPAAARRPDMPCQRLAATGTRRGGPSWPCENG